MPRIFVTGATGYLGGYTCVRLLDARPDLRLALMVRAKDREQALDKLWKGWQLHLQADAFRAAVERVDLLPGDLHADGLGLRDDDRKGLLDDTDSILHIAASLNRKSEHACLNTNLRGTLSVLTLARQIHDAGGLRRFSMVSTAAVAGTRWREVVTEDHAIEWDRRQYDPYARTKAFTEHMMAEVLPDVPQTVFRPSSVLGDSRHPATTQWDMVRAFCFFADLPLIPWGGDVRQDIVNADYVGDAISHVHLLDAPRWRTYHLSAGTGSARSQELVAAMVEDTGKRPPRFVRRLKRPFEGSVQTLDQYLPRGTSQRIAGMIKVFLPYVTNDTVFDNGRIVAELGRAPVPFTDYCGPLYRYAKSHDFRYPYLPRTP